MSLVLQQNDAFLGDALGGGLVRGCVERAGFACVENVRGKHHAQVAPHLVVQQRHGIFAFAQAIEEWVGQIILVIRSAFLCANYKRAHFQIQAAKRRFTSA